ncbi:hypothetical protein BOTBODRAFT_304314 [Botryobasidium botryosum FD-172 SS1]|uniref:Uncharacterized protein n=1 Tax=Botryobasidium botryosum (strain FD-172 SS1) TaxID=930990 RepID=A0A067MHX4_BOTB1|nr:hypothetical protein BOTBODRAFT_304314 [Botryobasidium botryosum FD-172 SS1]
MEYHKLLDPSTSTPQSAAFDIDGAHTSGQYYEPPSRSYPTYHPPTPKTSFFSSFEPPNYARLALHVFFCLLAFPIIYFLPYKSTQQGLPIFWTRTIVAVTCGIVGTILGISLFALARRNIEAAMWATVIHDRQLTLSQFSQFADEPLAAWSAIQLARIHFANLFKKGSPVKFIWIFSILFYLCVISCVAALAFAFGRIVVVREYVRRQSTDWITATVPGDLSADDLTRAGPWITAATDTTRLWTYIPASQAAQLLPPSISFPYPVNSSSPSDQVYFPETQPNLLRPDGSGLGSFDLELMSKTIGHGGVVLNKSDTDVTTTADGGIWWPRWGIRAACQTLESPQTNLAQRAASGASYTFITRSSLSALFGTLRVDLPSFLQSPANLSAVLLPGDSVPSGLSLSSIALAGAYPNNGQPLSFSTVVIQPSSLSFNGWVTIDTILIRLNTSFTPLGVFGGGQDSNGIGYDAMVCVEAFEPWVLETYNGTASTSVPRTNGIVGPGLALHDAGWNADDRALLSAGLAAKGLNATGKDEVFRGVQGNARSILLKDRDPGLNYVPSPTVISFSNTTTGGPLGYNRLSPTQFARTLAMSDASNLLPFLVGTLPIIAHTYRNIYLASAYATALPLAIALAVVASLGVLAAFFVPKLPSSRPRRDFGVFGWMAAMEDDEMLGRVHRLGHGMGMSETPEVELADIRAKLGRYRVKPDVGL